MFRPEDYNFIKKETLVQAFSYEFCEISKNTFFTEHLRLTIPEVIRNLMNQIPYAVSKKKKKLTFEKRPQSELQTKFLGIVSKHAPLKNNCKR